MKHLFIVNPVAGGLKGRPEELAREIQMLAEELNEPFEIYYTKGSMDATAKIKSEAESETDMLRVYACGGDGTLNECANGAANRANVAITHYPCGTGNDFIRTFGTENIKKFRDLRELINGTVRALDLIDCAGRYGINICSVGVDARIGSDVHKYSRIPIIGGATGYVVSLIANMIKGVSQYFRLNTEGFKLDEKISLACACNGRFYGGGFNPVPDALPDDGKLDFLVVRRVSRLRFIQIVGRYAKGKARTLGDIIAYSQGECLEIEGDREFVVNIDGEIIHTEKISFKVVPGGVNFIFPSGLDFFNSRTQ